MTTLSHTTQGLGPWTAIRDAADSINDVLVPAFETGTALKDRGARVTRRAVSKTTERLSFRDKIQQSAAIWRRSEEAPLVLTPSCESDRPGVVVVGHRGDLVAHMVSTFLRYDDIPVWDVSPHQLAKVQYFVRPDALYIQGSPVRGVMLRWSRCPDKAGAGLTDSEHCGDTMVIASWLAAADKGPIRMVNNYDSDSWRGGTGWSVWERRLSQVGVSTIESGQPAGRTLRSLVACGNVVAGPGGKNVQTAAGMLKDSGVQLATVTTLPTGRVANIETQPNIQDARLARRAAVSIIEHMAS
ncbi:MAG: hypothetical protein KJN81_00210 [Acidimicrobiia bacterium]|nr:hypothetical protein [Acidimicrobiia bacterium]NNL26829.1 hypothetical protein [Acidimicrobiia bacterium]